jgi:hypothetical protein
MYATDKYGWPDMPALAKKIWARLRVENTISWYACDCEITSPTSVTLFVYDIGSAYHGGIGRKTFEANVTEFTEEEKEILNAHVMVLYTRAADNELERREEKLREAEVVKIRKELFGV